jgi:intergrase/recombinase
VASYASYAVPLESSKESSFITRPLAEILRDMNKRVPDKVLKVKNDNGVSLKYIPWYHANRMLSFYAPGSVFSLLPQKIFFRLISLICGRDPGCVEEDHCVTL